MVKIIKRDQDLQKQQTPEAYYACRGHGSAEVILTAEMKVFTIVPAAKATVQL